MATVAVSCRLGLKHDYDVVEGPMADDTIWDYFEDYMAERISKEAFWELVEFKYPAHSKEITSEAQIGKGYTRLILSTLNDPSNK